MSSMATKLLQPGQYGNIILSYCSITDLAKLKGVSRNLSHLIPQAIDAHLKHKTSIKNEEVPAYERALKKFTVCSTLAHITQKNTGIVIDPETLRMVRREQECFDRLIFSSKGHLFTIVKFCTAKDLINLKCVSNALQEEIITALASNPRTRGVLSARELQIHAKILHRKEQDLLKLHPLLRFLV